jgi:hypothetical protein
VDDFWCSMKVSGGWNGGQMWMNFVMRGSRMIDCCNNLSAIELEIIDLKSIEPEDLLKFR